MLRNIAGIIAGLVAAIATIWLTDLIGHNFYDVRTDVNPRDQEAMAALIQSLPAGAQAFVVAAWFLGALVGGLVAGLIIRRRWAAWLMAGLVAGLSILNVMLIPHPEWMMLGAFVAPLLGGLIASHLVPRRTVEAASVEEPAPDGAL